jgi:metal-responsive CopG/Arc/MetJ family transcriptional regulator
MDKSKGFAPRPKGGKDWQNITVNITPELAAQIEAQRWREKRSRADFVRRAVEYYLAAQVRQ